MFHLHAYHVPLASLTPTETEEGTCSPGTRTTDGWEPPCRCRNEPLRTASDQCCLLLNHLSRYCTGFVCLFGLAFIFCCYSTIIFLDSLKFQNQECLREHKDIRCHLLANLEKVNSSTVS